MLKNLQILRALAALAVAFYHFNFLNFNAGAFGVDIFFVISGFIISYTVEKNSSHFFMKRVIRIVPMYYLFTFFLIVIWSVNPLLFKTAHVDFLSILKSFLFIPYFNGPILLLGYTLNFEMYFYIIVSCCLLFTSKPKNSLVIASCIISLLCIANYIFSLNNFILKTYANSMVIEFIFGVVLYYAYKKYTNDFFTKYWFYTGLVFSILALGILLSYTHTEVSPMLRGFLFGFPALIICAFFVFSENYWNKNTWWYNLFLKLGNASYIMYLIHPFVIFGVLRLIDPLLRTKNIFFTTSELIISITAVCVISSWLYNKLEIPVQAFLKKKLL